MYQVNQQVFQSFLQAIDAAKNISADVFEIKTGLRRWTPAPQISTKKIRQYAEQKAAYAIYARSK